MLTNIRCQYAIDRHRQPDIFPKFKSYLATSKKFFAGAGESLDENLGYIEAR